MLIMHTSLPAYMPVEVALAAVPIAHTQADHSAAVVAGMRDLAAWGASECPSQAAAIAFLRA